MKATIRTIVLSSVLATVAAVSTVNAQSSTPEKDMEMAQQFMQTAQAYVQSAVGADGNVFVSMRGDVAILTGFVENASTRMMAEQAALKDVRVNSVENHLVNKN